MDAPRLPLAPIARTITPLEWVVVLGAWLALDLASAGPLHTELTGRGIAVTVEQVRLAQLLDWGVWAALLPVVFRVLDRFPLRRATWTRHLPAWLAAAAGFGVLHAALSVPLIHAVAAVFEVPADSIVVPALRLAQMARDDIDNFTLAILAYLPLQVLHRNRAERARAGELERSLREARLHSLALELQPHFLFNTLNGIAALVRSEPRAAEQMLVKLSDLLRLTLDAGTGGLLPLSEELRRLGLYLALQQMRHGDRLAVEQAVPPELGQALVPAMLLQPLAENAISHGIGARPGPGTLRLAAARADGQLVLSLEDDGIGVAPGGPARQGIGLGNTRSRLAALYPGAHQFQIGPRPGGGTRVEIRIPWATAPAAVGAIA